MSLPTPACRGQGQAGKILCGERFKTVPYRFFDMEMGLYSKMKFLNMGDRGLLLEFGDEISRGINEKVKRMALAIQSDSTEGIVEIVPTYRSLLVLYDPLVLS